jgi:hypothetical protein
VQVLDWSRAQVAIMRPDTDARALNVIVNDLMNTRDGATYFAGRVWGVLTRYDVDDTHSLAGRVAPNFEFEDGTTVGELIYDGRGILLDLAGDTTLESLAMEFGNRINYLSGVMKEGFDLRAVLIRRRAAGRWFKE